MQRLIYLLLILTTLIVSFACSHDKHADETIERALTLLDERPDSALAILDAIHDAKAAWPEAQRMRYALAYAQAQNKAYVPFTTDSVVLAVADYYYRHGSDNERMMANYMVGCAYRDLGDAPTALKYLNKAVESVDASDKDCDLSTLMRVHSQMGGLYQNVLAFENDRFEEIQAENLAWQIGDTISAIQLKWARACSLFDEQHFTQCLSLLDSIEEFGQKNGLALSPDLLYPLRIEERLYYNDVEGAKKLFCIYEQESGITPNSPDDSIKYHGYYRQKGRFYNMAELPDEAISMYHRCIESARLNQLTPIDQLEVHEEYYRGLLNAYTTKHQPDSVIKYANLYCQFNDSTTRMHSSEQLLRMQSLYNYSKAQEDALVAEQKASHMRFMLFSFLICVLAAGFGLWRFYRTRIQRERQRQMEQNAEYQRLRQQFEHSAEELQLYKSDAERFREEKEAENAKLREALSRFGIDATDEAQWNEERNILASRTCERLHDLAVHGKKATQSELDALLPIAESSFPAFHAALTSATPALSPRELIVSTLIRFRFISSEVAVLTGMSAQSVTNMKSAINKKLFQAQGAKTLEARLMALK